MMLKLAGVSFSTRPPKSKYIQRHFISFFCMSLICWIYHGNVADHDDTIVRRGVRPGVTAVQLRLHPAVTVEPSVKKKMSTVLVFVVKIGGRK